MARRAVLIMFAAVAAWGGSASAADATLAARGNLTFTVKIPPAPAVSCTATSAVQFLLSGSTFLLQESVLAGQSAGTPPVCIPGAFSGYTNAIPGVRQCTPLGGVVVPASALTVLGSTYTIKSPYTTCAGKASTDTIVITAGAATMTYKHDLVDADGTEVHISGTLARDL